MRVRQVLRVLTVGVLSLALAGVALAASVHFKPHDPVFTDQGTILLLRGSLAGLSNADLVLTMTATAVPTAECTNRGGGTAPGQNPATVAVLGSVFLDASSIQNGQVFVSVTTAPPTLTWEEAGCPNSNWTATVIDMDFIHAVVDVVQNGEVVLHQEFDL